MQPGDVPSCYDALQLTDHKPASASRHLVVIVDQTARLDDALKKSVHQQVEQFVSPGDQVQLVAFSANAQGKYTDLVYKGWFDSPLPADVRNSIGKMTLNKFDACIKAQVKAKGKMHQKLRDAFGDGTTDFPKTELIGSILQVGTEVLGSIGEERKVLLIVSDMLENSSITSFYSKNSVRKIDSTAELAKVSKAGLSGDFAGADVYVIGAGFVGNGMAYSSQQALGSLESFWRALIEHHSGQLKQFGKPQLLSPMQ
ncbi:MAG: hypothetical protein E6Q75_16420 [Rheinheimera sp.]|nr:MAG: hypothetical protein E6Q75_16420 [Rheinheimera sp.]